MIYESHLRAAQESAWRIDADVDWEAIDVALAADERALHSSLHDAALIEGYLPVYAARLMQLVWDDVDACAVLSLELFEGLKHYTALARYLELAGFRPSEESARLLVAARRRALEAEYLPDDVVRHLTNFTCSELFAAYFFLRLARETREPVLASLLTLIARDEFRHSAAAGDVLRQRVDRNRALVPQVLEAAEHFRHYGSDIVDVPVAAANDFEAIMAMNRRIRAICGMTVTEHLEEELVRGDQ